MSRRRILLANQTQGGGGFSPLDLNPNLWLDATDASTITEVSGAISQWDDKSGNNYNVSQSDVTKRPTNGGSINGLNAIDLGGGLNKKRLVTTTASNNNWQDVYMVLRWDGSSSFNWANIITALNSSGTSFGIGLTGYSNTNYFYTITWLDDLFINTVPTSLTAPAIGVGNPLNSNALLSFSADNAINVNGFGVGGGRNNDDSWYGVIGEVVAFPRKLSATERGQMNTYLTNKWGL